MNVIVFDKDGVLVDSVKAIFHEAVIAYRTKGFVEESKPNLKKFSFLYPFAKKAEDLYCMMKIIEEGKKVSKITSLDSYDRKQSVSFRKEFYSVRRSIIKNSYKEWLGRLKPFGFAVNAFNNLAGRHEVFISTASDLKSCLKQLKIFGINSEESHVIAKEFSPKKEKHFRHIAKILPIRLSDILFIDNNLEQLKIARKCGMKTALASWGSNSYQVKEAKEIGIDVLGKHNLLSQINKLIG